MSHFINLNGEASRGEATASASIFMRDIGERKKERAEQKESERERMDTAQRQHDDLISCIKEQQTAMARQQEILLAIVNSIKEK
jgi:hypothetical protein